MPVLTVLAKNNIPSIPIAKDGVLSTEAKGLLKEIAQTSERRPHNLYKFRRFRNTTQSFTSDQSSSKPDSMNNLNIVPGGSKGNTDLAEIQIHPDYVPSPAKTSSPARTRQKDKKKKVLKQPTIKVKR